MEYSIKLDKKLTIFSRILTSEISLDGSEKVAAHGSQTMCEAAIKYVLVRECLYFQGEDSEDVIPQKYDLIWFESKGV